MTTKIESIEKKGPNLVWVEFLLDGVPHTAHVVKGVPEVRPLRHPSPVVLRGDQVPAEIVRALDEAHQEARAALIEERRTAPRSESEVREVHPAFGEVVRLHLGAAPTDPTDTTYLPADPRLDLPARVRIWDVYQQRWVETARPSDGVLASLSPGERAAVLRHLESAGQG